MISKSSQGLCDDDIAKPLKLASESSFEYCLTLTRRPDNSIKKGSMNVNDDLNTLKDLLDTSRN